MADLVKEWKKAVHEPEVAALRTRIAELVDALRQIADTQIAQAEPTAHHMKTVARLALQAR